MATFSVYIGDADNYHTVPEGENPWHGNFPHEIGPSLVPGGIHGHRKMFSEVRYMALSDDNEGGQSDWGCWVAIVTRDELLAHLDTWYGAGPIKIPAFYKAQERGKGRKDDDTRLFVRGLDPKKRYALVAMEDP